MSNRNNLVELERFLFNTIDLFYILSIFYSLNKLCFDFKMKILFIIYINKIKI